MQFRAPLTPPREAGADVVIAIGHCGIDEQSSPWTSRGVIANTTGLDAFIDGHSHSTILASPKGQVRQRCSSHLHRHQAGPQQDDHHPCGKVSTELVNGYRWTQNDAFVKRTSGPVWRQTEQVV